MSNLWKLNLNDWQKGLIVAILTAVLTAIYESVSAGSLTINWKTVATVGITAGIGYILKNLATGANGRILTNYPPPPDKK